MNLLLHLTEHGHPAVLVNWAHVTHAIALGDGARLNLSLGPSGPDYGPDFLLVTESLGDIAETVGACDIQAELGAYRQREHEAGQKWERRHGPIPEGPWEVPS